MERYSYYCHVTPQKYALYAGITSAMDFNFMKIKNPKTFITENLRTIIQRQQHHELLKPLSKAQLLTLLMIPASHI